MDVKIRSLPLLFLFCMAPTPVTSYTLANVTALRTFLFDTQNYDKISRPMMDQSAPTVVTMTFNIYTVYDIDEVMQTLKISGSLGMEWLDEALMWSANDFGGIQSGVYPQDDVWKPGVALKNSVEDYKTIGDPSLNVIATPNGTVSWEPYQVFTSRCAFDITHYPFDKQTCKIIFVTWGYRSTDILIQAPVSGPAVVIDDRHSNPEWNIETVTYETANQPRPMMIYHVTLQRKPRYVVNNIVLPLVILLVLNVCVFLLPSESGEKSSYAVTVFLSFVVFSTVVHATLPPSSEHTCFLSVYMCVLVFQSAVITIFAINLIRFTNRTDAVPHWIATLACGHSKRKVSPDDLDHHHHGDEEDAQDARKHYEQHNGSGQTALSHHFNNISGQFTPEKNTKAPFVRKSSTVSRGTSVESDSEAVTVDWKTVAQRVDMALFVFFLLANIILNSVFILVIM